MMQQMKPMMRKNLVMTEEPPELDAMIQVVTLNQAPWTWTKNQTIQALGGHQFVSVAYESEPMRHHTGVR